MATSGQKNTGTVDGSYFWVNWSQASQDITNNKTKINWSCGVYCGHNFYLNAIKMSAVSINGTQVYSGGTYSNFNRLTSYTLASGTLDIPHNSDGTKTFTISAFTGWLYDSGNYSASASSYTLNTIPRKATVSAGTDFTDEDNPTITFSNPAGFNLVPYVKLYDNSGNLIVGFSRTKGKYTSPYTFVLTNAERATLRQKATTQKAYTVHEGVETYNGSSNLGSSSLAKTMTIVNATPDFGTIDAYDTNSDIVNITGDNHTLILGKSSLGITWGDATAKKSASISSYKIEWQGQTQTVGASATKPIAINITASGSYKLKITATDSRGYTKTVEKTIEILPYAQPTGIVTYGRLNNYEDEVHLKIDGSFSSIKVSGAEKNAMTIQWRWRKNLEGQGWSDWITIDDNVDYTYNFPKENEYVIQCKVTDTFGSLWDKSYVLAKGKFPLFIDTNKNAVGINDFPAEGEAFRVKGNTFLDGDVCGSLQALGNIPSIPANSDLNDYMTAGVYGIGSADTMKTIKNRPCDYAGKLTVDYSAGSLTDTNWEYIKQTYTRSDQPNSWYRMISRKGSKTWEFGDWERFSADYIVEQGTSGIWTYEKWNSGKAVCRGTIQGATGTFTSHGIGVYYSKAISTRLPNNLFSTVSYAIPTMISGGGGLLLPRTAGVSVSVVQVDFVRFYGGSDSLNIQYAIEVKGRWK